MVFEDIEIQETESPTNELQTLAAKALGRTSVEDDQNSILAS